MKIQSKRVVIVPLGVNLFVASGILLSILLLSLGDTLEVIPIFASLTSSFLFQFFHDIHDLLALVLVLYVTYRYDYRLGTTSILFYVVARLLVAFIWLPEDMMGLMHTIVASLFAIWGVWLINELHKTEKQRKLSYETLLRSEEKYRDLYENAPVAYYSVGADGLIKESNTATQLLLGYSREELLGKDRLQLYAPESITKANVLFEKFKCGASVNNEEMVYLAKDGSKIYGLLSVSPVLDADGQVIVSRSVVRDITETKRLNEQLIFQDRLVSIGQLVSGVAHEINNPLTSIVGFSELLMQRDLPSDVKADLIIINNEANRTASIVRNLLTFVRKQAQEKTSLDINENIRTVQALRNHEQKTNNIQVNLNLHPNLPRVLGNNSQLQQVFLNLIVNAEQAMLEANKKGSMTITTELVGNNIEVSVADDGPGISPENMNKLFTPFFTTKGVGKGTGLGLSVSHGIITEHGGRIYAESEAGKGATFIVELPVPKSPS